MPNATEAESAETRTRAKPLPPDDRRAGIIDAVTPLLIEHGRYITTKQIADAAGIAEGTVFRVFPDKEAIIEAAVEKFLDPTATNARLRAIDPESSLEGKINDILFLLRSRMTGIFGMMQAAGMSGPPPRRETNDSFHGIVAEILAPNLAELQMPPERIATLVRLIAFASAIPQFNQGQEVPTEDLARFITYGIAGAPAEGRSADAS